MDKQCVIDTLGWGLVLWLIGYVSGILLFFALPVSLIGWAILPVGVIITFWVLFKQIRHEDFRDYAMLAVAWTAIAVACDYVFIVVALKPVDGTDKAGCVPVLRADGGHPAHRRLVEKECIPRDCIIVSFLRPCGMRQGGSSLLIMQKRPEI